MHILVINFTAETTPDQFDELVKADAPVFAGIEGLLHKNFIFNHAENTYGGIYMFESKAALENYLAGDIYASVEGNPDWSDGVAPLSLTPDFWDRWISGRSQHANATAVSG